MTHLLIYGTLRKASPNSRHHLLERYAKYVAEATMQGRLYEVNGYPGAVLSKLRNDRVFGELYKITNKSKLFALLDRYEECGATFPLPHEYKRSQVSVQLADGSSLMAWVYLYNRNTARLQWIASGDYLNP